MPIAYGQCKGRKYHNEQPIYEPKKPEPKDEIQVEEEHVSKPKRQAPKNRTCSKCGEFKPIKDFATKHFCKACMNEIESKCILGKLGGE